MNIHALIYAAILTFFAVDHTEIPMGCTEIHRSLHGIHLAKKVGWKGHNQTIEEYSIILQQLSDILECDKFSDDLTNRPTTFTKGKAYNSHLNKKQCPAIKKFFAEHKVDDFSTLPAQEQAILDEIGARARALKCFTLQDPKDTQEA